MWTFTRFHGRIGARTQTSSGHSNGIHTGLTVFDLYPQFSGDVLIFLSSKGGRLTEHDSERGLSRSQGMIFDFYAVQHDARLGLFSRGEALQWHQTCCNIHKNTVRLDKKILRHTKLQRGRSEGEAETCWSRLSSVWHSTAARRRKNGKWA